MVVVPPVARNMNAPLMPVEQIAGGAPLTTEQRLMEYIARIQAEGLATRQHLSNPAALGSEAIRALYGYFERANALQNKAGRKARVMSDDDKTDSAAADESSQLPAGPASNNLQLVGNTEEIAAKKKDTSISEADFDRAIDAMLSVMSYSVEIGMITTASSNMSKSTSTLIRGQ